MSRFNEYLDEMCGPDHDKKKKKKKKVDEGMKFNVTLKDLKGWLRQGMDKDPVVVVYKGKEMPVKSARMGDIGEDYTGLVLTI